MGFLPRHPLLFSRRGEPYRSKEASHRSTTHQVREYPGLISPRSQAEEHLAEIKALPIEIVPAREWLVLEAARIKAEHRLAYADAFAVATGRAESAPIITGDPEILALPAAVIRARKLERNA